MISTDKISLREYLSRHFEPLMEKHLLSAKIERLIDEVEMPDLADPAAPRWIHREPSGRLVLTLVIEE